MTTSAKDTFGAQFKMADSGSTPAVVAELTGIGIPGRTRGVIDVTTHDGASEAMEYIAEGVYDLTEFTVQGHYIAGSTEDDLFAAAIEGGVKQDCVIVVKAASGTEDLDFAGFVTAYSPDELSVNGKQTFSATIKPTGPATQAATV